MKKSLVPMLLLGGAVAGTADAAISLTTNPTSFSAGATVSANGAPATTHDFSDAGEFSDTFTSNQVAVGGVASASDTLTMAFSIATPDMDHFAFGLTANNNLFTTATCDSISGCAVASVSAQAAATFTLTLTGSYDFILKVPQAFNQPAPTQRDYFGKTRVVANISGGDVPVAYSKSYEETRSRDGNSDSGAGTTTIFGTLGPGTYSFGASFFSQASVEGDIAGTSAIGWQPGNLNIEFSLTPLAVPVPAAAWLLLSGVGALAGVARRRKRAA